MLEKSKCHTPFTTSFWMTQSNMKVGMILTNGLSNQGRLG